MFVFGATVSTVQLRDAGVGSIAPPFLARTRKLWGPSVGTVTVTDPDVPELGQAAKGAESTEHSKAFPATVE